MDPAFRRFMTGLVDYAGLFPPARLDMAAAVNEYHAIRQQNDVWMLGKFICPAGRLEEMAALLPDSYADRGPWSCSVLAGNPQAAQAALADLPGQLAAIRHLEARGQGSLVCPALEIPIPVETAASAGEFVDKIMILLGESALGSREVFLEIPGQADSATDRMVLKAIAGAGARAKFRCGGVTAAAFPSVERLGGVIAAAAEFRLPLKFTAGLHHPVRHQAAEPVVMMHGFLNVFGAALLAFEHGLDQANLAACLAETDPTAFSFTGGVFRWREFTVAADDVARWRQGFLSGFGSCSFDEPRADLRDLQLLD